jgi:ADP-heptose:LPS heptosyltransferase
MHRRILILRLDAIGDFVLFTGALSSLRERFNEERITLALNPRVETLARHCPYVDEIITIDPLRFTCDGAYIQQIADLVRDKYDLVINAMYSRTEESDNIVARTRSTRKVGFECSDNDGGREWRRENQVLYTDLIPSPGEWKFEVDRYLELLRHFGRNVSVDQLSPRLWLQKSEHDDAMKILHQHGLQEKEFAIICPSAGFPSKLWSAASFAQVASELGRRFNLKVVVIGSSDERRQAEEIADLTSEPVTLLVGSLDLRQFAALTALARIYVGLDTAGFHLAWVTGIPTVGIFGGGHFGRFAVDLPHVRIVHFPMDCYGCYWHCIYDEVKCITSITPQMVISQVDELLKLKNTGVSWGR